MSRKHSISALLNQSSQKKSKEVTCDCDECNGSVVDSRTKFSHKYREKKKKIPTKQEFTFKSRTRNIQKSRIISLGQNPILNHSSSDDEVFENNSEFNESFDKLNNLFEDYSAPDLSNFELLNLNEFTDSRYTWILLWIMNFRIKFNLPDTATEALLKFIKLVLIKVGGDEFESFCGSLYIAKNLLGLSDQFVSFVACQKCHKLYKQDEILQFQQNN